MSNDVVVIVAVVILVGLFSMQHYGTDKVGWAFAPLVLLWFLLIGGIGIFNMWKYGSSVLRAFSPVYVYRYFKRGGRDHWASLGGIMLSITGTEALFADLGHFPVLAIQIAFTAVVFPCLLLAYCGQAAYIVKNTDHVVDAFYRSIPDSIYWPVFVVATLAAIVASQATISATFSIIKQALALGCFPRVKVVHTSKKFQGQIYIPDINWVLMLLCIAVTAGFKNQSQIGNAYGSSIDLLQRLIQRLSSAFDMKDLGELHMFLGLEVYRSATSLQLSQTRYALQLLDRFDLTGCKPVKTPLAAGLQLSSHGTPLPNATLYRQMVGSLQYLTLSRPDLTYVVNHVCQFMQHPTVSHMEAVKRIFRYVKGTIMMGLEFSPSFSLSLRVFSDADWTGCPDSRRSISGYAVYLGPNLISWGAKK